MWNALNLHILLGVCMAETNQNANQDATLVALQTGITSIIQDVESGLDNELGLIHSQIDQIKSLLKDAIASLYENFEKLDKHTSEQMKFMDVLVRDATGESEDVLDGQNIFQRTNDASRVLKDMVAREIESSEQALTAFMAMEKLKLQIKSIDKMVEKSDKTMCSMAELTHITGDDSGELINLIGQEKKRQERVRIAVDSLKKQFLIAHRHLDISANRDIKDIYAARESVEQLLQHIYDVDDMIASCRSNVTDVNGSIRKDLGRLVRSLQFEDIVGQSLGHTGLHLNRVGGFLQLISQGLETLNIAQSDDVACYTSQLKQLQSDVENYRQGLRLEDSNPVSQQNMDEGDVDLF